MPLRIRLKIIPQFITQCIFTVNNGVQYILDFQDGRFRGRKRKLFFPIKNIAVKTYNHYSLTMLWHITLPVHNKIMNRIPQLIKSATNYLKSIAFIVRYKVFHIFKEKSFRSVPAYYVCHIKEQSPLRFVLEACLTAKALLFRYTSYRKWLTGETCAKYIKLFRNIAFRQVFCYISKRHLTKISKISFLCILVPFRRKNTLAPLSLHSQTETTHTSKQIYKSKRRIFR